MSTTNLDLSTWSLTDSKLAKKQNSMQTINFKTPYELIYKKLPDLKHLKVWMQGLSSDSQQEKDIQQNNQENY
jgi:hypothetical protein